MGDNEHSDIEGLAITSVHDFFPEGQSRRPAKRLPKVHPTRQIPRDRYLGFLDDPVIAAGIARVAATKSTKPKISSRTGPSPENFGKRTSRSTETDGIETYSIADAAKLMGTSYSKAQRILTDSGVDFLDLPNAYGRMSKRLTMNDIKRVINKHPELGPKQDSPAKNEGSGAAGAGSKGAGANRSKFEAQLDPNVPQDALRLTPRHMPATTAISVRSL